MLDSYGDLRAGGKISASTVFDTIIHITLLKYFKSLVTCDLLFKQTSKKEDPSICFRSASLENFTLEHRSAVLSDFECHSPFTLLHKKVNCNNNRRVSPNKPKKKNNSNNNNNNNINDDSNHNNKNNDKKIGSTGYMCPRCTYFESCALFVRYHHVAVSSLEAIRRLFGVGELSYILLLTELLMCIMMSLSGYQALQATELFLRSLIG